MQTRGEMFLNLGIEVHDERAFENPTLEVKLATLGFFIQGVAMLLFAHSPTYGSFFLTAIPLALGSPYVRIDVATELL